MTQNSQSSPTSPASVTQEPATLIAYHGDPAIKSALTE